MLKKMTLATIAIALCTSLAAAQQQRNDIAGDPIEDPQARASQRVLVAPFEAVDPDPGHEWIGRSIERNLAAELARLPAAEPIVPDQPLRPAPIAELLETARRLDAHFLITGEYHVLEPELRLTGQVVEVHTGRIVGGLQATGILRGLFAVQDEYAAQVRRLLPQPAVVRNDLDDQRYLRQPTRVEPTGPVRINGYISRYEGSQLQRAVQRSYTDDRYYYQPPVYHPHRFYGFVPYHPWHVRVIRVHRPVRFKVIDRQVRFDPTRGHGHVAGFMPMTVQQPMSHIAQPPPMIPQLPNPPVPVE